jgi:hypothetical protein
MKINLETVRQVLKDALGFDSFVASFITEVSEDSGIKTAGIDAQGHLICNFKFVDKYITCREDLFSLLFHELLHPMFGHFIYGNGDLENIAADAIINATISTIYPENSKNGNLFRKLYSSRGLQAILRSEGALYGSKYIKVYEKLYGQNRNQDAITTGELIQTLKILSQSEKLSTIVLIGSHGQSKTQANQKGEFSNEVLTKIAEDVKRSLAGKGGRHAGFSLNLLEMFLEALKTHLSIRRVLLQKFLTKRKIDRFKEYFNVKKSGISPIPIHPSKRDLVLLASGFCPAYYHNQVFKPKTDTKGLAIYLDVSGSVNEYLPKIISIIANLKKEIISIFLFSNAVVETRMEDLMRGKIRTTYGTDFNCIAKSISERVFQKAVIITDGFGSMNEENEKQLKGLGLITLTILFGQATGCEDFAKFGDIVFLDDVCD